MDCSLPGSSIHGIFQARVTGLGCHCLLRFTGEEETKARRGLVHDLFKITQWQSQRLSLGFLTAQSLDLIILLPPVLLTKVPTCSSILYSTGCTHMQSESWSTRETFCLFFREKQNSSALACWTQPNGHICHTKLQRASQ